MTWCRENNQELKVTVAITGLQEESSPSSCIAASGHFPILGTIISQDLNTQPNQLPYQEPAMVLQEVPLVNESIKYHN